MLIVQKYGGSSVAGAAGIKNVADKIAAAHKEGHKVVAVLSAQGDTTDEYLRKAAELCDNPPGRELDRLLSTGEQHSVALMAIRLAALGLPVISLGALQAGIHTTSEHGTAKIKYINTERILRELENGVIVLVAGFQGVNDEGDITTLGRGGSDTTAVALAVALDADACDIYTDVEGVFTTDPRLVTNAKKYDEIGHCDMLTMATAGAKVLHNRSVELAGNFDMDICVRSSMSGGKGTRVTGSLGAMEGRSVVGCALDRNVFLVSLRVHKTGNMRRVFKVLAKQNINVDIISQFVGGMYGNLEFTVSRADGARAAAILAKSKHDLNIKSIETHDSHAKISFMGAGMAADPGVAARIFSAIDKCGGEIRLVATSETCISVLIKAAECEKMLRAVHDEFGLGG